MIEIHHLNCLKIVSPINKNVCGHCLLLNENNRLILIDTGIGLKDAQFPEERIGREIIQMVGYEFDENITAVKQIEKLGYKPEDVTDCIISHLDNDHIGGLADFPKASVHLALEEFQNFESGNPRYSKIPLSHEPKIITYPKSDFNWLGFEGRRISIKIETDIFLIPLIGHTLGHCGIALKTTAGWLFYIADAYYMRIELTDNGHPVNELARLRADDNNLRLKTLDKIRDFARRHPEVRLFGYHDIDEFTT